ncbi:MAG: DUF4832 domain-containing protein [Gemmatimonadetes bacterium]|jgi:hypothetical protein|nr:DUF4832 domain-containing protein [Gemmatimonadota bacterium]MBT6147901.1 DUF4832 domain-containing protein [Gemmatimonadota bacterium]MBT7863982.1 DUF4832 domain-containing protein [Gemmatimonadota bacterium]
MVTEARHKVRFQERREPLLSNPHKGCATFQRFNGDPLNEGTRWSEEGPVSFSDPAAPVPTPLVAAGYLPSTVSYCRWFWDVLEPSQGHLDFGVIEAALRVARERGQTLQVRLMPHGSQGQPQLPAWYQAQFPTHPSTRKAGRVYLEAEYAAQHYFDAWGRVITEFGAQFDGHPDLESVDLAFIGPWGEGAGDIGEAEIDRFVDLYVQAHPQTSLLANIDAYQFVSGIERGLGWRCDCFGDLGFFGRTWNHTFDAYPKAVAKAGAGDQWRTQPITLESCGVPQSWMDSDFDLEFILEQGLKMHASVFMPKSNPIPEIWLDPLARFCDSIGYRFVLRQAEWPRKIELGDGLPVEMWIENTGTAPIYRPYRMAIRLRQDSSEWVEVLSPELTQWLPGDAWVDETIRLPTGLRPGIVEIDAGIIGPDGADMRQAAVRFAVDETRADGWVGLGTVEIG